LHSQIRGFRAESMEQSARGRKKIVISDQLSVNENRNRA